MTTIFNVLMGDAGINNYASSTIVFLRLGKILLVLIIFFTLNMIDDVDFDTLINAINIIVTVNVLFIVAQRLSYQVLGRTLINPISYYKVVSAAVPSQAAAGHPQMVYFTRTNSPTELAQIYTAADYFVNPTYEDNYPTVNVEAAACGTYVVSYNTGGCRETIEK